MLEKMQFNYTENLGIDLTATNEKLLGTCGSYLCYGNIMPLISNSCALRCTSSKFLV